MFNAVSGSPEMNEYRDGKLLLMLFGDGGATPARLADLWVKGRTMRKSSDSIERMCGWYARRSDKQKIADHFHVHAHMEVSGGGENGSAEGTRECVLRAESEVAAEPVKASQMVGKVPGKIAGTADIPEGE